MNQLLSIRPWLAALLLGAVVACGGGGGRDEILGFDGTPPPPTQAPPTVTAVTPLNGASNVAVANPVITEIGRAHV
jgi:hypothetical protein